MPGKGTGSTSGRATHPQTMRQQSPQQNGNKQATSMRKPSQRAQTQASITTEYQERFFDPSCYMAVITTSTQKDPCNPLKGTSTGVTTFKSYYGTHKMIKKPPKAPQPSVPPKCQGYTSAPHKPVGFVANQMASEVEDYTSVYQNDFQAWKANKRWPYKMNGSLKVNQGPHPFESITSYRSDFVSHPVQPRTRREKPVYEPNKCLPLEPAVCSRPKGTWDINQEHFDKAMNPLSNSRPGPLKPSSTAEAKPESSPPAFLSTTQACYTAHKCQRFKPVLLSMQTSEKSKKPFQTTTTMKEDYKAWGTQRHSPTVQKSWTGPRKPSFQCTRKPADSCKTSPKPLSPHTKLIETTVWNSSYNATEKRRCPAESGSFFPALNPSPLGPKNSDGNRPSLDRGETWPHGGICEEPSDLHQIISCMVLADAKVS